MKYKLHCHIMDDDLNEVGKVKVNTSKQEFEYKKRMWALPKNIDTATWRDKKGIYHLHVHVNESDGIIRFLEPKKFITIDICKKCGNRISIDAKNVWDLMKRRTITAIWGIDNTFTLLLILMGIIAVGAIGALFYVIGENQTLQTQIQVLQARLVPK